MDGKGACLCSGGQKWSVVVNDAWSKGEASRSRLRNWLLKGPLGHGSFRDGAEANLHFPGAFSPRGVPEGTPGAGECEEGPREDWWASRKDDDEEDDDDDETGVQPCP